MGASEPEWVRIASDEAGNTLVRRSPFWIPKESPTVYVSSCAGYALLAPDGQELQDANVWLDLGDRIYTVDFDKEMLPRPWLLWLLVEIYNATDEELRGVFADDRRLMSVLRPGPNPWIALRENLDAQNIQFEVEQVEKKSVSDRWDLYKSLAQKLEAALRAFSDTYLWPDERGVQSINFNAFAIIAGWMLGNNGTIQVYRQSQDDGTVRVAYVFEVVGHSTTRFDLVDALRDSGVWVAKDEVADWLEQNMVDPEWLIDPTLFEPYTLLNTPNPLSWDWSKLIEWLRESDLLP